MGFNFKDLEKLYVEAVEGYAESLVETDAGDMDVIEEPSVILLIDNPRPKDGSEVDVLPGLSGVVTCTTDVDDGEGSNKVTAFVEVKCGDIEKFLAGIGLKVVPREEIIVKRLKGIVH